MTRKPVNILQLISALKEAGVPASVVDLSTSDGARWGINVWADPAHRYADDTVYPPTDTEGWVWGPSFEHSAPADAEAATVAQAIKATLQARS